MTLTQINKAGLDEIALDHVFTIGASGNSAYTFQGEGLNGTVNNPTLYLTRGKTYRFENGSGGHPIRIQSTSGASGTAYNTGVTNNAGSGTVIVEVQHDAPDVLYYQCTSHAAMNGILYITGALSDGGVTTAKIADLNVTTSKIAHDAINSNKLADNAVVTAAIADNAVTTAKINGGAVTTARLANSAVTADKIAGGAVGTARIADGAVTGAKIASSAITNTKISPNGIASSDKIADGIITTAKIAANAVTNAKIVDDAITTGKLADNAVTNAKVQDTAITTGKLADNAVTTAKIQDQAITSLKIANGSIATIDIADGAVVGAKIADGAIVNSKIPDDAINAAKIGAGACGTEQLANGAVTAAKLASGVGGKVLQVKSTIKRDQFTAVSNGSERTISNFSVSITPSSTSNKIIVVLTLNYGAQSTTYKARIYRNSNLISSNGTTSGNRQTAIMGLGYTHDANQVDCATAFMIDDPQSTSSNTYSVRVINDNNQTLYVNRSQNDHNSSVGGRFGSTLTVIEVADLSANFTG